MKKRKLLKKTSIIIVLSLVICTMLLSPITSFASVSNDGNIDFDFIENSVGSILDSHGAVYVPASDSRYLDSNRFTSKNLGYVDLEGFSEFMRLNLYSDGVGTQYDITYDYYMFDEMGTLVAAAQMNLKPINDKWVVTIKGYNYYRDGGNGYEPSYKNITSFDFPKGKLRYLECGLVITDSYNATFQIGVHSTAANTTYCTPLNVLLNLSLDSSMALWRAELDVEVANNDETSGVFVGFSGKHQAYSRDVIINHVTLNIIPEENKISDYFAYLDVTPNKQVEDAISNKWQEGYQEGYAESQKDLDRVYAEGYEQGYDFGFMDGALSVPPPDSSEGYDKGYNKGYNDGMDDGFRKGTNATNAFVQSFDKLADSFVQSVNIFSTNSDTIFGINLMSAICTFVALGILWSYIRKVF